MLYPIPFEILNCTMLCALCPEQESNLHILANGRF
jgi:hypothetical protein